MPDGGTGPSSENDPNKDMLQGEPSRSGNPTSATSNPGVSGVGGQGMQDAGGKDEGKRGFDAAKAGIGPFGQATLEGRTRSWIAENAPSLFMAAIPGANALSRAVGYARSAGYDVQDVTTDPDGGGGGRGDLQRDRSKALSNAAAASDAASRRSTADDDAASALNGSASLNRQGYASGNRRRRSLFDSGSGSASLGGG